MSVGNETGVSEDTVSLGTKSGDGTSFGRAGRAVPDLESPVALPAAPSVVTRLCADATACQPVKTAAATASAASDRRRFLFGRFVGIARDSESQIVSGLVGVVAVRQA